ncbi:MAG: glycoside hydrolase family 43 protein [Actinoallomurus sp.]
MVTFANPILPGSYPDPSVCRVGPDFYLVSSTFEWFPGLPVLHSRDLVHWREIGHVLDRPEQLPLDGIPPSRGLYAPTIRYHEGLFHVVCTLVDGTAETGNFLVTATDPAGPWSQPRWLGEEDSFDPSLLFDDGRVWFHAVRAVDEAGHTEVWLRELDLDAGRLVGPEHMIWRGALRDARWAEGPHLFRIGAYYYLLAAEGGTALEHAVSVARATAVTGPYESNPRNPVLTHRHLGASHPIGSIGHADLVETLGGEWWATLLATRPGTTLGRETFLTPVLWEDGWPVFPGVKPVETRPDLPEHRWPARPRCDHFDGPELGPQWVFLRTPRERFWETGSGLRLRLLPEPVTGSGNPSLIARRQRHRHFAAFTSLDLTPVSHHECAGLILLNGRHQIRLEVSRHRIRLMRCEEPIAEMPNAGGRLALAVEGHGRAYRFRVGGEDFGPVVDGSPLGHDAADSFTGAHLGLYATSNGLSSTTTAYFPYFEYAPIA